MTDNDVNVIGIQETHVSTESDLFNQGEVSGYCMIGATYDDVYRIATYERNGIQNAKMTDWSCGCVQNYYSSKWPL